VVNASLNVTTIQELAALAKAKPGTLSYGTFAFPAVQFMEKLKKDTGADIVRVPFRGGAEIVTAVLSGTTPVAILALSNMIPQLQSGRIKALAIGGARRSRMSRRSRRPALATTIRQPGLACSHRSAPRGRSL
jgi:tripartite-type tricarboxylate transporter receptor subunit TctC